MSTLSQFVGGVSSASPTYMSTPDTFAGVIVNVSGLTSATSTSSSPVDVVNYTGAGVLEFCAESTQANVVHTPSMTVTIDGVAMPTISPVGTGTQSTIGVLVGAVVGAGSGAVISGVSLGAVPFNSSLQISHTSNGSNTATCRYKYRRTV